MKPTSNGSIAAILALTGLVFGAEAHSSQAADPAPALSWLASWTASPQPVWEADFLFPTNVPPVLHDQTVRLVARISLGGQRVRIVLSNAYGRQPVEIGSATVALSGSDGAIVTESLRSVTFGGRGSATIPPGAPLVSDPVELPVSALSRLTVSFYLPNTTPVTTFHWDGRETSWIVTGDRTSAPNLDTAQDTTQSTTARLLLSGIDVETAGSTRTVAVIGDSITDGATASLDANSRWPDFLAGRLAPFGVAVINAGISGARLLSDGMGVNALARLDRDVLDQHGVRSVIVLMGINDISWPGTAFEPNGRRPTFDALIAGYLQLIDRAHSRGVRVIGATLTPFEGALPGTPLDNYYQIEKDALRRQLNAWIKESGAFDAVIDFDAVARDPSHPARLNPRFDSGDHLHPGDAGNHAMSEAISLDALLPGLTLRPTSSPNAVQEH
ncbi:SGNH/GDSL hydrolase family protein [Pseudomonas abietaniphila]|uniref:SGNH/GDSL hydrolase family protein n=1 Tax=Pseudomonas abietaniphila TaxID=89065 RepID=UPI0007856E3D|nr:SGNH/GDSL hydrolase family protein [Pseudomonas abietaniphila]